MELELAFAATQCNLIGNWTNKLAPYYLLWVITNLAYKFIPMLMFKVDFLKLYFVFQRMRESKYQKPKPSTPRIVRILKGFLNISWKELLNSFRILKEFSCCQLLWQDSDFITFFCIFFPVKIVSLEQTTADFFKYSDMNGRNSARLNSAQKTSWLSLKFFLLLFSAKAQLGLESFVGENTYIAEKTTIKNCIIGANCKINEKVRLTNCVIMNNVTISSLNIISGSIICDDVETSQNCEIKDCIVSRGHHFGSDGEKHTNEVIGGNDDRMMEI